MKLRTAVLMAAGRGDRMFPVSDYVPKPLIKVYNKPLIDHSIEFLQKNRINNIYITYGYKANLLLPHVESIATVLLNTTNKSNSWFVFNSIIKHLDEDVLILPCDIIFEVNLEEVLKDYIKQNKSHMIVPVKQTTEILADRLRVDKNEKIVEINRHIQSDIYASGIQIVNPKKLNTMVHCTDSWYGIWNQLIKKKRLVASRETVTRWESYDKIEQLLQTQTK